MITTSWYWKVRMWLKYWPLMGIWLLIGGGLRWRPLGIETFVDIDRKVHIELCLFEFFHIAVILQLLESSKVSPCNTNCIKCFAVESNSNEIFSKMCFKTLQIFCIVHSRTIWPGSRIYIDVKIAKPHKFCDQRHKT